MYDELKDTAKQVVRPFDESFEATIEERDEMTKTISLANAALVKATETLEAEGAAFEAMFENRQLAIKRSEAVQYWTTHNFGTRCGRLFLLADNSRPCELLARYRRSSRSRGRGGKC